MSKRKSTLENKKLLLHAGLQIIIQQGYNHTGIQQLVDEVGIPKGSFYNYFDSKEDFGKAIVQHYAHQIRERLDAALSDAEESGDALAALKEFFAILIASYEDKQFREGCLVGNLAAELSDINETIRLALSRVYESWQEATTTLLTRARTQGSIRSDIPPAALASFLWNSFEGALLRMKVEKSIDPLEQWFAFMLDDFLLNK